jgi:thiamine transporter ThiT
MEHTETNEQTLSHITTNEQDPFPNPPSVLAKSAYTCGIIAVILNLIAITAVVGIILSIISIVLGAKSYDRSSYGKAGFVLGLLSLFIIAAYVLSAVAVMVADPFI